MRGNGLEDVRLYHDGYDSRAWEYCDQPSLPIFDVVILPRLMRTFYNI